MGRAFHNLVPIESRSFPIVKYCREGHTREGKSTSPSGYAPPCAHMFYLKQQQIKPWRMLEVHSVYVYGVNTRSSAAMPGDSTECLAHLRQGAQERGSGNVEIPERSRWLLPSTPLPGWGKHEPSTPAHHQPGRSCLSHISLFPHF